MAFIGLVALCFIPLVPPLAGPSPGQPAQPVIRLRPDNGLRSGLAGQSS